MNAQEMKSALKGICGISITPFDRELKLDEPAVRKHLRYMVDHGISKANGTMVIGGSTGYCGGMNVAARKRLFVGAL